MRQKRFTTLKMALDQRGYVLGLVMIFFVIFNIMGLAFVKMGSFESVHAYDHYETAKATYNAIGGIHEGLWRLNYVSTDSATFSDSTASVVFDSNELTLTATGQAGNASKTIKVTLASGVGSFSTVRPEGVGSWSNNEPSGCSSEYQCVDEAVSDDDGTYVSPEINNDWRTDTYATEDGAGSGIIDSVITYIRVRADGDNDEARTVLLLSGTRYYGSILDLSGVNNYTNFSTTHTTNPDTGSPWAWSEIAAMQIGVRLYRQGGDGPRCTQVWAEVYYPVYKISKWEEP